MVGQRPVSDLRTASRNRHGLLVVLAIVLLVLLLLSGERLALVGKGLGQGVKAFRRTVRRPEPQDEAPRRVIIVSAEVDSPDRQEDASDGRSSERDPGDSQKRTPT